MIVLVGGVSLYLSGKDGGGNYGTRTENRQSPSSMASLQSFANEIGKPADLDGVARALYRKARNNEEPSGQSTAETLSQDPKVNDLINKFRDYQSRKIDASTFVVVDSQKDILDDLNEEARTARAKLDENDPKLGKYTGACGTLEKFFKKLSTTGP